MRGSRTTARNGSSAVTRRGASQAKSAEESKGERQTALRSKVPGETGFTWTVLIGTKGWACVWRKICIVNQIILEIRLSVNTSVRSRIMLHVVHMHRGA